VILFVLLGIYGYNKFYKPTVDNSKYKDVANVEKRGSTIIIYMFYVNWCPYCKKAKPDWDQFSNDYNGKIVNGYTIQCVPINCDDDSNDAANVPATPANIAAIIDKYGITSYPTVKMIKDGNTIDFDSRIRYDTLQKFVDNVTLTG
jgi:thiol-disulfide isomerase/thioredoxin